MWFRANGSLSDYFSLGRGTYQGCPLYSALFGLALEPLAILIWADPGVRGIRVRKIETFSLYSDDALLYLADASSLHFT